MKLRKKILILLLCLVLLIPIIKNKIDDYMMYSKLSEETKEWLDWYCKMDEMERMFISYYPEELSKLDLMEKDICK